MRLRRISEAIMGSRDYKVPTDPMALMADFYLLDLLENGAPAGRFSERDATIAFELKYVSSVLLPALRKHLLEKAGFSIACEMRHLYDTAKLNDDLTEDAVPDLSQAPEPRRKRRRRPTPDDSSGPMDGYHEDDWEDEREDDDYDDPDEREREDDSEVHPTPADVSDTDRWLRRHISDQAADILKLAVQLRSYPNYWAIQPYIEEYAKAGLLAFSDLFKWSENYGGKPWRQACQSWLDLQNNGQRMYIDRIYQLQHNNGNLLDKNQEYKGKWLPKLLDAKYVANNPEDLVDIASPYMRTLTGFVLRSRYGRSYNPADRRQKDRQEAAEIVRATVAQYVQIYPQMTLEVVPSGFVLWNAIKPRQDVSIQPPANAITVTIKNDGVEIGSFMDRPEMVPGRVSILGLSPALNHTQEVPLASDIKVFERNDFNNRFATALSQAIYSLSAMRWC